MTKAVCAKLRNVPCILKAVGVTERHLGSELGEQAWVSLLELLFWTETKGMLNQRERKRGRPQVCHRRGGEWVTVNN